MRTRRLFASLSILAALVLGPAVARGDCDPGPSRPTFEITPTVIRDDVILTITHWFPEREWDPWEPEEPDPASICGPATVTRDGQTLELEPTFEAADEVTYSDGCAGIVYGWACEYRDRDVGRGCHRYTFGGAPEASVRVGENLLCEGDVPPEDEPAETGCSMARGPHAASFGLAFAMLAAGGLALLRRPR